MSTGSENTPSEKDLIYDWAQDAMRPGSGAARIMVDDETLRDGLQSPSVHDPRIETKLEILHLMESLGVETANVGLPGAGERQKRDVERLCREIADQRMRIRPNCAGRTMLVDIQPMADVMQRTGVPIEACLFIGSSPIRQYAEEWELDHILRLSREAIRFAVAEGLPVMYVTEDTVRSSPEHLGTLLSAAVEQGAKRLCLCDTVGAAVPAGARNLVSWVKTLVDELGVDVGIDWHGHRDRGLDVANTLAAIEGGATRVHGTALGIGERVGNTPLEQILVNLNLLGWREDDLTSLGTYVNTVSRAVQVPIPINQPIVGRDAFRTATGVHAAAVIKAARKGEHWLADRVYSGVPATRVGRRQEIEIGPMSGNSNVIYYLTTRDIEPSAEVVQRILDAAKKSSRLLTEPEVMALVNGGAVPGA